MLTPNCPKGLIDCPLDESDVTLKAVIDKLAIAVLISDNLGNVTLLNKKAEEIGGNHLSSITKDKWKSDYAPKKLDKVTLLTEEELPMVRALKGETTENLVVYINPIELPYGKYISVSSYPLLTKGEIAGTLTLMTDISETVRMKEALKEFKASIESLKAMVMNAMSTLEPDQLT